MGNFPLPVQRRKVQTHCHARPSSDGVGVVGCSYGVQSGPSLPCFLERLVSCCEVRRDDTMIPSHTHKIRNRKIKDHPFQPFH